jgi:hypothetical protein
MPPRLPDFLVIGAAKSATTTLHAWLGQQPDVFMSTPKEPGFFTLRWDEGFDWYTSLFVGAPPTVMAGESSTYYTQPPGGAVAAPRIAEAMPDVRIVYVVRHPIDRMISHYRHLYRRARTSTSFAKLAKDPDSLIVATSLYFTQLKPYADAFPREQICVVRMEDLVGGDGWGAILAHLGREPRPAPTEALNVFAEKPGPSRTVLRLSAARRRYRLPAPPRWADPVSAAFRNSLRRDRPRDPFAKGVPEIPAHIRQRIWDDVARLEEWLGVSESLWARP